MHQPRPGGSAHRGLGLRRAPLAWLTLVLGLAITAGAALQVRRQARREAEAAFSAEVDRAEGVVDDAVADELDLLRACQGFFDVNADVDRRDWTTFIRRFELGGRNPEIVFLGFAPVVPVPGLEAFEARVRAKDLPDYRVRRDGERSGSQAAPLLYLESPLPGRERLLGFDLLSHGPRRAAVQRVLDGGETSATGLLEPAEDPQLQRTEGVGPTVMTYALVSRTRTGSFGAAGEGHGRGVVSLGLQGDRLLARALPDSEIRVEVWDLDAVPARRLFAAGPEVAAPAMTRVRPRRFADRRWELRYGVGPGFGAAAATARPAAVAAFGAALSLLLFGITATLARQRQEAEALAAQLREGEEWYRDLVDQNSDLVFRTDLEGRYVFMNRAVGKMLGYGPEELMGQPFWATTVEEDREPSRIVAQEVLEGQELENFPVRKIHRDGSFRWLYVHARRLVDAQGRPVGIQGTMRDATDLRRTLDDLQESEDRFRTVAETAPCIIVLYSDRVQYVNSYASRLLGYSNEELLEMSFWHLVHPDDQAMVHERGMARMRGEKVPDRYEFRIVGKDGAVHWVDFTSRRMVLKGQSFGLGTAFDVSERVEAVEARVQMERKLLEAQKLESLGVLAGGIAHDFNNLLAAILGNVGLAKRETPEGLASHRFLDQIQKACERAADLTRQMLAYAGRGRFHVEVLDLNELVRAIASLLEVSIPKHAELRFELSEAPAVVEADVAQLQQVIMNLVTNAAEAIAEQGGSIALRTGPAVLGDGDRGPWLLEPDAGPGDYQVLEVRDTGQGMDPETLAKIFEPFFTTKFTGRGLGLAALRGIVRSHRGGIQVESERGRGTRFRIYFPASGRALEEAPMDAQQAVDTGTAWTRRGAVLVVDDEPDIRAMTVEILQDLGCEVLEAEDGEAAMEIFHRRGTGIAAVLLDLTMPGMGGEEVFRRLQEERPGLPVVLSSGYAESEVIPRLGHLGLAGFLQKPYRMSDLIATLQRAVGG